MGNIYINMDKQTKEKKKSELVSQLEARIAFLQTQIDNLTKERDAEINKIKEEMETLVLQSDALINFKIK